MMKTSEVLRNDVEQQLRWDPRVSAEKIGVSVNDGVVELDGHVGSLFEKWAAEDSALRVRDVRSIASEIIVDLPSEGTRSDEHLALAASNHLIWNFQVPETIKVMVADGWLILSGTAEWHYQKEEAERVVRSLNGVRGVSNEIELRPKASAFGVILKIEDALRRDAQIEANNITVEASGSGITLAGKVHSYRERQEAERAAFNAPGVTSVENLLTVNYF
jgi:osmotically-inducible protein OsmY